MRDQLHLMELVDNYLDGSMNNTDRAAFEERLRNNEELRSLVEDQQRLRRAARRSPARAAAKKAYRNYRWGKMAPGLGAGAVVIILATAALLLWRLTPNKAPATKAKETERSASPVQRVGSATEHDVDTTAARLVAGSKLHIGSLTGIDLVLDPRRDTTVITPGGVVIDIPLGAFVNSQGQTITTTVFISVKEALDPVAIVRCGLSTMTGNDPLETGGMLRIAATSQGHTVGIDKEKPLTAMIPTRGAADDMLLYEGVALADGSVDWTNPVPMRKSLVPVDIMTLNFYPPGYEKKLVELKEDVMNRTFRDSLFYSFSFRPDVRTSRTEASIASFVEMMPQSEQPFAQADSVNYGKLDSMRIYTSTYSPDSISDVRTTPNAATTLRTRSTGTAGDRNGIDPAKIKAIWNARFNGTDLATKEFEARLAEVYRTCDNSVLDAYVDRLDVDLSEIDKEVASKGYPVFVKFSESSDGRVELPEGAAERLRRAYERWSREEAQVITTVQEDFWREQQVLDQKSAAKQAQHGNKVLLSSALNAGSGGGPLTASANNSPVGSIASRFAQLRSSRKSPIAQLPRQAWVARIFQTGWVNCDRPLFAPKKKKVLEGASASRTKAPEAVDAETAAILATSPLMVKVQERTSYDELVAYLIPKGRSSFQRLPESAGAFSGTLYHIYSYDVFCLGMKGKQQFAFKTSVGGQSEVTASLQPVDENALRQMLHAQGELEEQLLDESRYLDWLVMDKQRRQVNTKRVELRNALLPVVFPCALSERNELVGYEERMIGAMPTGSTSNIDKEPQFPGGSDELQHYMATTVQYPRKFMKKGIGGKVYVRFKVSKDGSIRRARVVQGVTSELDAEALRVVRSMPSWSPAIENGQPVEVELTLPVDFRVK